MTLNDKGFCGKRNFKGQRERTIMRHQDQGVGV